MGIVYVSCEVAGIQHLDSWTAVDQVLADTGSASTWVLEAILKLVGVTIAKRVVELMMANGQTVLRPTGDALVRAQGFVTVDEVVLGQPGDLALLGAHALEGFGVKVELR